MVRLPPEGDRIVGGPVDRRRDLEGADDRCTRRGAHLDELVIIAERLLVRRVQERNVRSGRPPRPPVRRRTPDRGRPRFGRPCRAGVVGDRAEDPRADERAFLTQAEVAPGDDGVAVAPRSDVFLVEQIADAALVPAAAGDPNGGPCLAAVARVGHDDVGVEGVRRADESESQSGVVGVSTGVEREGGVARALVRRSVLEEDRDTPNTCGRRRT